MLFLHFSASSINLSPSVLICFILFSSVLYFFCHSAAEISTSFVTTFLMVLALWPNRRVDLVSSWLYLAGDTQMMTVVRELPPKLCLKRRFVTVALKEKMKRRLSRHTSVVNLIWPITEISTETSRLNKPGTAQVGAPLRFKKFNVFFNMRRTFLLKFHQF